MAERPLLRGLGVTGSELLARARNGEAAAFAVLVHRHAPRLHALASATGADDPDAVVVTTFARAMRRLEQAPAEDLAGWLAGLQAGRGDPAPEPAEIPPLPDQAVDALWSTLAPRWPSGRRRVRPPRWFGQAIVVVLLLVLSVAVPYLLLVTAADRSEGPAPLTEIVAEPLEEDDWPGSSIRDEPTTSTGTEDRDG